VFDDRSPIYVQIARQLEDDIVSGALGPNDPVWSTNQYATTFRINPATAAKGLQQLVDEGFLYKKRGIGMFVSPDARERLLGRRRERFVDDVVLPMLREAERIGFDLDDVIGLIGTARAGDLR
jgi:GntR family transcriptional regulator